MSSTPTISVREWTDVVRRARLGKTTKYVALMLATFADYTDGSRIYPGIAALAHAAEVDYKTAQKSLSELLAFGLIEVVGTRPGARGRGTEYRLVVAEDIIERVKIESPTEFRLAAERIGSGRRRSRRTPHGTGGPPPEGQPTDRGVPVDNSPEGRPTERGVPVERTKKGRPTPRPQNTKGRPTPRPKDAPPRSTRTSIEQPTTENIHTSADLDTAVTGSRASPAVEDPQNDSKCVDGRCARGVILTAAGSLERCPHPSHGPPSNVIPFPTERTA